MKFPKRKAANGNGSEAAEPEGIAAQLAKLKTEDDAALRKARDGERALLEKHEQAEVDLVALEQQAAATESALRAERLKLAKGLTASVKEATAARAEADDRVEGERELLAALADEIVQARERVREAQEHASERARLGILLFARRNAEARDKLFAQLERLTADALAILAALEGATTETAVLDTYNRAVGVRRVGFNESWRVLLGLGQGGSGVARLQALFRRDPYADNGGPLFAWRELACDAGLLDEAALSTEQRERRERERLERRQRSADALVNDAIRGDAIRVQLAKVWRPGLAAERQQ